MEASIRPWFATGVALVGASAIAMAPISPTAASAPAMDVRAATAAISSVSSEFKLAALDIPYILTLPIVRQQLANWVETWTVYLAGLGKAGVGLAQSLLAIPGVTVEIVQEVLALNFVGAFDTFTSAARDAVIAVGQPLLDSLIWRNQKAYAVQTALQAAVPEAFIAVINGFLLAGNGVTTSLIQGTQDFIAAVLTLNLSNIINAAVDGTQNFVVALGAGAGAIVAGIESAQFGIATALATEPPAATVADVSALRTLAVDKTITLPAASGAEDVASTPTLAETASAVVQDVSPAEEDTIGEADAVGASAEAEPQDPPKAPAVPDPSDDDTDPAAEPKPVDANPVKKVTAGAEKDAGAKDDTAAKDDAGTDAKPASDSDE